MNTPASIEEFAKRYNKICTKLKEPVLDKMFEQNWDLSSVKTIESDVVNKDYGYYVDDLVEIIDYYSNHKDESDTDYDYNLKELKTLLNYLEEMNRH